MRLAPCLAALALCLTVATTAQAQQVYQWKDKNGVTHYSDSPPPNQAAQNRRINQYGAATADTQPVGKSVENPQCLTARSNLQILTNSKGAVRQDTDGDGKPDTTLDDTARANQRGLAEAAVKAYCTPASP